MGNRGSGSRHPQSSKGQVTIRKHLKLEEGAQFIVVGDADVIILKTIVPPDLIAR